MMSNGSTGHVWMYMYIVCTDVYIVCMTRDPSLSSYIDPLPSECDVNFEGGGGKWES